MDGLRAAEDRFGLGDVEPEGARRHQPVREGIQRCIVRDRRDQLLCHAAKMFDFGAPRYWAGRRARAAVSGSPERTVK